MAAKRKTAKSKKPIPAVRYLRYELTNSSTPGTETSHYIDLARDISAINRRLYRQGRVYHIRKVTFISKNTPNQGNRISISTVPDSWTARNAWRRGFESWQSQKKLVKDSANSNISAGKFDDFKVYLSFDSRAATPLVPLDNGGNALQLGEWDYVTLYSPDGTTSTDPFNLHMLGDHSGSAGGWNSVSLIKSYGESRTTVTNQMPNQPSTTSDDPIVNLHDHGTNFDEIIDKMESSNDNAPYDVVNYPGSDGNMAKPLVVQDTVLVDGRAVVGGFSAICGLLEIESQSDVEDDTISVLVELAPGNYRGIGAEVI